jgi:hypothetical protein
MLAAIYKDASGWDVSTQNDLEIRNAVLSSLEKRWKKSDQDCFIAAVILNPFTRTEPFNRRFLNLAAIQALLARLWKRFYREEAPAELYSDVRNYFNYSEDFKFLQDSRRASEVLARTHVCFNY